MPDPAPEQTNKYPYVRGSTELLAHVSTHTLHKYNGLLLSNSEEAAGIIRSLLRDVIAAELRHPARAERDKRHKDASAELDRAARAERDAAEQVARKEANKREVEANKPPAPTPPPPMVAPGPLDRPLPGPLGPQDEEAQANE